MQHPDFIEVEAEPGIVIYRYLPSGEYAITNEITAPRYWSLPEAIIAYKEHHA